MFRYRCVECGAVVNESYLNCPKCGRLGFYNLVVEDGVSGMRRCLNCKIEFDPGENRVLFCSAGCYRRFRDDLVGMIHQLASDEDLFEVFDLVQSLVKKEALGL